MRKESKKTNMDIMMLYKMAKLLHEEAQRAAKAKEYASYPVFMNRYHQLHGEVCRLLNTACMHAALGIPFP